MCRRRVVCSSTSSTTDLLLPSSPFLVTVWTRRSKYVDWRVWRTYMQDLHCRRPRLSPLMCLTASKKWSISAFAFLFLFFVSGSVESESISIMLTSWYIPFSSVWAVSSTPKFKINMIDVSKDLLVHLTWVSASFLPLFLPLLGCSCRELVWIALTLRGWGSGRWNTFCCWCDW